MNDASFSARIWWCLGGLGEVVGEQGSTQQQSGNLGE